MNKQEYFLSYWSHYLGFTLRPLSLREASLCLCGDYYTIVSIWISNW